MLVSEKQVSDLIISIIMVATIVAIIVANPAIMQLSCSYHTGIMPKPVHICRIRFAGFDGYRQKKKHRHRAGDGADGMPRRFEPVRKKKITSRTRSRNRAEEGQEGIPGYPHKESADHHPYNPPRKRNSPPYCYFIPYLKNFS